MLPRNVTVVMFPEKGNCLRSRKKGKRGWSRLGVLRYPRKPSWRFLKLNFCHSQYTIKLSTGLIGNPFHNYKIFQNGLRWISLSDMLNLFQHPQILKLVQDDILPVLILELWERINTTTKLYWNFYFELSNNFTRTFASFSLYQDKENEELLISLLFFICSLPRYKEPKITAKQKYTKN